MTKPHFILRAKDLAISVDVTGKKVSNISNDDLLRGLHPKEDDHLISN
jgi:hypothetical protein